MENNENPHWRSKVQDMFRVCQDELKRTTEIGKKMLSASKTNSSLHEAYEDLGSLVVESIKSGDLKWEHPKVKELMKTIESCESNLEDLENEVNKIRFSAGPIDVSNQEVLNVKKSKNLDD